MKHVRSTSLLAAIAICCALAGGARAQDPGAEAFEKEVDRRLEVPLQEQAAYAKRLQVALVHSGVVDPRPQYFLLVDRSRYVQAIFIYWRSADAAWQFIGASPVSTGLPGEFEHFLTPLGAHEHSLATPDFRAEGTRNDQGILGYGRKGMRVYDFGWVRARRTWGEREPGVMRLQLHATDPQYLEPLLGSRHSEGCIRIAATLNSFIDRHGLLDADYDAALEAGEHLWVLRADREPTATPGRWLVVVESKRTHRPAWSPAPKRPARR